MMTIPFWTQAGTVDLADLRPEDLAAEFIADALAKINRYNGRTFETWSVAAHSVLVERLCPPEFGPWALLHDAHEFVIGDITTPAVELIAVLGNIPNFDDALALAKARIDRVIATAWHLPNRSYNDQLRRADRIALCAETIMFMGVMPDILEPSDREDTDRALTMLMEMQDCCKWQTAKSLWLSRVEHYAALGGMTPPKATSPADMASAL
ncbi:hypothetical protein H4P12_08340 [Paracoccus sp. 11-3]|uniref:Uncharacterized protein n=1 Tax=Paracoccus amoyensis TaxID=2760093 RepID=A0A926GCQ8_9RHOB|nr:hypothetical protein [Paracoccus amoyensis]MBC9246720.1 hypothetical protein [Paracoccus amoyensis]